MAANSADIASDPQPDWSSTVPDPLVRPTVSVEEAGDILGIGRHAAYSAAKLGHIPTIRLGRKLLVPTAALRRMLGL